MLFIIVFTLKLPPFPLFPIMVIFCFHLFKARYNRKVTYYLIISFHHPDKTKNGPQENQGIPRDIMDTTKELRKFFMVFAPTR